MDVRTLKACCNNCYHSESDQNQAALRTGAKRFDIPNSLRCHNKYSPRNGKIVLSTSWCLHWCLPSWQKKYWLPLKKMLIQTDHDKKVKWMILRRDSRKNA